MLTFQNIIKQAGDALFANELGDQAHVSGSWNHLEWLPFDKQAADTDAELDLSNGAQVRLYPSLLKEPKAVKIVLREFGLFLLNRGGERAQTIWDSKLIAPASGDIELYASKLKDKSVREKCHTYEDLLKAYPQKGHSVERLIAIHFSNALLANNVSYPDSIGVDIYNWGPTAQFAAGKKYFSLVPLTSAYCPGDVHRCFGCAFAALILDNFSSVLDKSVAAGLRIIIRNVIQKSANLLQ